MFVDTPIEISEKVKRSEMTSLEATSEAGAERGTTTRALAAALGPNFAVAILFVLTLFTVVLTYGGSIRWKEGPILISGGIVIGLLTIRTVWWLPSVLRGEPHATERLRVALQRVLYDWGPLVIVMWMFESLEPYTGVIRKTVVDQQLYELDVRIFGIEPSVWMGRFHHPLLTDWMSVTYGLYFITPIVMATTLSLRGRRSDFNEMVTGCVIQMGLGFIIHLFIPAGPPRHFAPLVNGIFNPPHLHSWTGLMELQQGAFDTHDPMRTHSSFPSLHCSFGMLTLLYAYRFGAQVTPKHPKLVRRIVAVLVVSLWISTVYLRHHWVPDCIAGMILGAFSVWAARRLRSAWPSSIAPAEPL
jgi:membrane-associated phospholipid phosphatase